MNNGEILLQMKGIDKAFPGVHALDHVDFTVRRGQVHALVGENGAGKSTLIKILSGVYTPDAGEVILNGQRVDILTPAQAESLGISPVHQELNLALHLSVAENIFLGHQPMGRFGLIDTKRMYAATEELLGTLGISLDPRRLVEQLSVAQRQMVSIARALSSDARIVIMDEPTASLTDREVETLFRIIRGLSERGIATIYISHRLEEVFQIADQVTILRDGRLVGTWPICDLTPSAVINRMIGRELSDLFRKCEADIGKPILEVRDVCSKGILNHVSFTLHAGEILGIAGLVGAGRTELARAIYGADRIDSGQILVFGKPVRIDSPQDAIRAGIGLAPEDRKLEGLLLAMSVRENITLASLPQLSRLGFVNRTAEQQLAKHYTDLLAVKTPSLAQQVMYLSGGNQQRVVLAKWLATGSRILILDEPTRGIDVGAKADIHGLMSELARKGVGIMMISSELPEILAMSDRILVMHRGEITGEFGREEANEEAILRCAMGERRQRTQVST